MFIRKSTGSPIDSQEPKPFPSFNFEVFVKDAGSELEKVAKESGFYEFTPLNKSTFRGWGKGLVVEEIKELYA